MLIGKKVGPFQIEKELGSGAMGAVYRAIYERDDGRRGHVALKFVSLALLSNEGALARFERESAILKQLRHPNIVRLVATGRYQQAPFIAMEYIDGQPLDRMLAVRGRLAWEDVVTFGKQLCDALQHAHEKGIVHRDLKPSNLMITKGGQLKLTDFGIAKDDDATALTAQNNTIGTAAYMSPEQCQGSKSLDNKSDLYSLGVVFYELLTGKKPFAADTTMDLFLKHVKEKAVRPAKLVPGLPVWLDNLVMFLLEKDKDQRPMDASTVGRMLADIEEKVAAGVSAGEAVAKARKIDRPLGDGTALDAADKAATQAIRGKKKKKKKPERAWYEAAWVRAVPLVLALAGIGGAVAYFVWPEGMAKRYAVLQAADPATKRVAAEEFLRDYRDRGGKEVEAARAAFIDLTADEKERILLKRLGSKLEANSEGFDPDQYSDAIAALKAERAGDLGRAVSLWTGIQGKSGDESARLPEETAVTRGCLGWIAAKHLHDIRTAVPAKEAEVRKKLDDVRLHEETFPADEMTLVAVRGLLFDDIKDAVRAKQEWQRLKDKSQDVDKRVWLLLAAQKEAAAGDAKDNATARVGHINERLAAARKLSAEPDNAAARRDAHNRARELVLMYDGDLDESVRAAVKAAKELAQQTTKGKGG